MAPTPAPIPAGWAEHKTDDGTSYWYNSSTGVSQVNRMEEKKHRADAFQFISNSLIVVGSRVVGATFLRSMRGALLVVRGYLHPDITFV